MVDSYWSGGLVKLLTSGCGGFLIFSYYDGVLLLSVQLSSKLLNDGLLDNMLFNGAPPFYAVSYDSAWLLLLTDLTYEFDYVDNDC